MALTVSDLSPQLSGKPQGCVPLTNRKLAVRFIPPGTTKDEFFFKFKQYGTIQSIALLPPRPGARYCFGFVEYSNPMSACTAKLELDRTNWGDCMVSVEWAQPKHQNNKASLTSEHIGAADTAISNENCNVLEEGSVVEVKNIPITATQYMFRQLFSKCGKIKMLYMYILPPDAQAFSGFVQFSGAEEALRAVAELDGKLLHGNHITVQALRLLSGFRDVKSSVGTEFHPNMSARHRAMCPCPPTVRPSISINVLHDYGAMRFGCPPFAEDSGADATSNAVTCSTISCSLYDNPDISAGSHACAGGSPVASKSARESGCAVGGRALSGHSSPSHAQQSGRSFLNTHRGRVLAKALGNLEGCSLPRGKEQDFAVACRVSMSGTECSLSPVQAVVSSSAEIQVQPVPPPGAKHGMSPVQPMLPPGADMSPVQPVLPPGADMSPVRPMLPSGADMSPVQPVLPPGADMSPVQTVLPPGAECGMSPVQVSLMSPPLRLQLSPLPPPLPSPSPLSPPLPTAIPFSKSLLSWEPFHLQPQDSLMQSMLSNGEAINHRDVETSLSVCVGENVEYTKSLINERASVTGRLLSSACCESPDLSTPVLAHCSGAIQMDSAGLMTPVECLDCHAQLPVTQMVSPGFSVQVEHPDLPMQAEYPGLTVKDDNPCLPASQVVPSDTEGNVCMSVPVSFLNASSSQVGSNKEAVSTSLSLQTVARRRRVVRIAAVFPGDATVSAGHQEEEGTGPANYPEQDVELAKCPQRGLEPTQHQEDHVELTRCQMAGVGPTQLKEDRAEAARCPQGDVEPAGCQLKGAELPWCQGEGAATTRLQKGGTLPVESEDPLDLKSVHARLRGSGIGYGTSVDSVVLPGSCLEESESDSSVCVSNVPDPSLSHSCSSCESSLCLSGDCAANPLDQPNGKEERELSNRREEGEEEREPSDSREELEKASFSGKEEEGELSCVSRQDQSHGQLLQGCLTLDVESGIFGTSRSSNKPTSGLPAPALYSCNVSVSPIQKNQLDQSTPLVQNTGGISEGSMLDVEFGTEGPGVRRCCSPGSDVWVESNPLFPQGNSVSLENSIFARDKCCILLQSCLPPPSKGGDNHGNTTGDSAVWGCESATVDNLKRTAMKLQVDLEKICRKNEKTSELIEAEMSALDQEKWEPCLPLGIQPERVEMYDRIIRLHAQWVFETQWVRYREEQEKAAVLAAEKQWGKDSNSFIEFKLCQQIDTLKAQLSAAQLLASELQLKEEFYAM